MVHLTMCENAELRHCNLQHFVCCAHVRRHQSITYHTCPSPLSLGPARPRHSPGADSVTVDRPPISHSYIPSQMLCSPLDIQVLQALNHPDAGLLSLAPRDGALALSLARALRSPKPPCCSVPLCRPPRLTRRMRPIFTRRRENALLVSRRREIARALLVHTICARVHIWLS